MAQNVLRLTRGTKSKVMNEALALPQGLHSLKVGDSLAFLGLPSKRTGRQLSASAEELMRNIATILDQIITGAIEKRTAQEFIAVRDATFPDYARVMLALANLVSTIVPVLVLERITLESLSELEADFRDHAAAAFGTSIRDQAIFTVWTLRKINELSQRVTASGKVPDDIRKRDAELAPSFNFHALRTRFHLDCLTTALRTSAPIYPEVLNEISDGLRSEVDAYAWIRQAVDLRFPAQEPVLPFAELDEEDRQFIDASVRDMATEFSLND